METLLKNWRLRMVNYRQEADNCTSPITRVKAMNKFLILRDCIKELEEQLMLGGVVGRSEQFYCTCSRAKGLDHDEEGMPYCIECQKPVQ